MAAASPVVHYDPDILGGTPVFVGTRVPVRTLLDYLEGGDSLKEFLEDFPSVTRGQAVAAARTSQADPGVSCESCLTSACRAACGGSFMAMMPTPSPRWALQAKRTASCCS